jgi:hypothetical protein
LLLFCLLARSLYGLLLEPFGISSLFLSLIDIFELGFFL